MVTYAGFGRRLWGAVLDAFVDLLVLSIVATLAGRAHMWPPVLVWMLIHHVACVVEGGTIGHRAAGMRILRESGEHLDAVRAVIRAVVKFTLSWIPLGLGFLWMLDDRRRRTWHDVLGGSIVVRERPVTAVAFADPVIVDAPTAQGVQPHVQ